MTLELPPAVSGSRILTPGPGGDVAVYVDGAGSPLLLIHSINAAASAAEVRPLHERYRSSHRVYSVDLPGFGSSARADLPYSPRTMTDALHACVRLIRSECGDVPIDAAALSLGSEYLARAAVEAPSSFRSIALVSPTGFKGGTVRRAPRDSSRGIPWLLRLLNGPGWGASLYRQLTRPGVIRYFLRRTWGSSTIDETLWRYDILTARQPHAEFAPLRFLSGYLFSGDIHTIYEALSVPVWMSHGVRGDFTDYRNRRLVEGRSNWQFSVFQTGALPHFEVREEFCKRYDEFLAAAASLSAPRNP